jgi:hypothetical protein
MVAHVPHSFPDAVHKCPGLVSIVATNHRVGGFAELVLAASDYIAKIDFQLDTLHHDADNTAASVKTVHTRLKCHAQELLNTVNEASMALRGSWHIVPDAVKQRHVAEARFIQSWLHHRGLNGPLHIQAGSATSALRR